MRSIWTGSIGFGLVSIPIKLYSAVQDSSLDLDLLDKKDHSHIRFMRVNEKTGKEVDWENIVKGYDYNGKYVILTDKDFTDAEPEKTKVLDIFQFADLSEIDSMYFETPYYIEPDKNASKPYALLKEALTKSGMAGVCSFVLRNKEHLAVIKPHENALVLNRIRFEQEIKDYDDLKIPGKTTIKPGELKMAMELIKQMTGKFDISDYKDTYTDKLMKFIKAKAKGVKVKEPTLRVAHKTSTDLMEQLKASLSTKKKRAS